EYNASDKEFLNLFQIWVFPKVENIKPRYDQRTFLPEERKGKLQLLVSPGKEEGTLWVNQDVWFSMGDFAKGSNLAYAPKLETNGVYLMVIDGEVEVAGQTLGKRDAIGIWDTKSMEVKMNSDASLLLIDVPMAD
ncbi:MAG TPA: hypothetical protein VG603_10850, partial [Chitinophagales bacterium]|nr:hypothetical protein [Chitinophagales bacterium]